MPTPLTFSGAPIPNTGETNNVPAVLLAFGNAIDDKVVLKATSVSNRDTLYANAPAGTLVSCAALKTLWQKTTTPPTAAAWVTLAEQGTAVTSGVLTALTGFTVTTQVAQRINGVNWVRGRLTYSGATITAPASGGNITDTPICTVQSAWLPSTALTGNSWIFNGSAGNASARFRLSSGTLSVDQMTSGAVLSAGQIMAFDASYPGA